mmetsp:Transcript_52630/g.114939  ORF Transcript_52630/g.114939 Transcript_52630/m.114939 type:complete len:608 (-) Transcript_52630:194-2017(-)
MAEDSKGKPTLQRQGSDYKLETTFGVSWKNLSYTVKTKKGPKTILSNATGKCLPGKMMALMGPSGCGKTTLMDLLADRISSGTVEGEILLGNSERRSECTRKIVSYVMSEDSLFSAFTVRETLRYTTKFVLANKTTQQREDRINSTIETMGLQICADSRVGDPIIKGISAGQKRRLSIALEMIAQSPVLMLDEPTSGLDAVAAFQVVKLLKGLCDKGHTVFLSIHQPSTQTFNLFDYVGLLARGKQIYLGPNGQTAINHFASHGHKCPETANPADFYIELVNTDFGAVTEGELNKLAEAYANSEIAKNMMAETIATVDVVAFASTIRGANVFMQFFALLQRMLHMSYKNPYIWGVRIVMYICLALMVGTMYEGVGSRSETEGKSVSDCRAGTVELVASESLLPCLYYVAAFLVFMSVAVLPFFLEIRDVFRRERANGQITCAPYVIADFVANLFGITIIAGCSASLVVGISGMNNMGGFFLNLWLALIVAESFMRFIGAGQPHYILGMAFGAGTFGMFMLCEGYMVRPQDIPDYWIWAYKIAFHTYSFEWFMYNQFKDAMPCGPVILEMYDMANVDPLRDAMILLGFAVLFQFGFFVMLYWLHTGRR